MRSPHFSPTGPAFNPPPKSERTSATRLRKCTSEVHCVLAFQNDNRGSPDDGCYSEFATLYHRVADDLKFALLCVQSSAALSEYATRR